MDLSEVAFEDGDPQPDDPEDGVTKLTVEHAGGTCEVRVIDGPQQVARILEEARGTVDADRS